MTVPSGSAALRQLNLKELDHVISEPAFQRNPNLAKREFLEL